MEIFIGHFFVSRDVVFCENIFAFQEMTSSYESSTTTSNHRQFLLEEDLSTTPQYILVGPNETPPASSFSPAFLESPSTLAESPVSFCEQNNSPDMSSLPHMEYPSPAFEPITTKKP